MPHRKPSPSADHSAIPVVFSHANSFALPTYRLLFSLLQKRGIEATGVQRFGHDAQRPVTNNWPHLVDELIEFADQEVQRLGQPVYLVGHSLWRHSELYGGLQAPRSGARRAAD